MVDVLARLLKTSKRARQRYVSFCGIFSLYFSFTYTHHCCSLPRLVAYKNAYRELK